LAVPSPLGSLPVLWRWPRLVFTVLPGLLLVHLLLQLRHPPGRLLRVRRPGVAAAHQLLVKIGRARAANAAVELRHLEVAVRLLLRDREQLLLEELVVVLRQLRVADLGDG